MLFCVVINVISPEVGSSPSAAPLALGKTITVQETEWDRDSEVKQTGKELFSLPQSLFKLFCAAVCVLLSLSFLSLLIIAPLHLL